MKTSKLYENKAYMGLENTIKIFNRDFEEYKLMTKQDKTKKLKKVIKH